MAANYGSAAFDLALARHRPGAQADAPEIADLYRTAIRLAPQLASAYKNLGLLLLDNGGPRDEIVAAWRTYLALEPADPQADAIRTELGRLEGGG
jgi:predicted TPR repeat methyltransferase